MTLSKIISLDLSLSDWFFNFLYINSGFFQGVFVFFARYIIYILVILFLTFLFLEKDLKKKFYFFWSAVFCEILSRGIITETMRFFFKRERPYEVLKFIAPITSSSSSFPSGHTVFMFTLTFLIFSMNKKWGLIFLVLSAISAVSRVIVGVHWFSDIVGGALISLIVYLVFRKLFSLNNKASDKSEGIIA